VFRAVARTWLDALKKPVVRASGDLVRFTVRKDLLEDDTAQVKALNLATSEDVQKAGVVVNAVLDAKPPPVEALAHFLGPDLAAWVLAPDATVQDCKQIGKHANDLSNAPDFPTDQFLPMTTYAPCAPKRTKAGSKTTATSTWNCSRSKRRPPRSWQPDQRPSCCDRSSAQLDRHTKTTHDLDLRLLGSLRQFGIIRSGSQGAGTQTPQAGADLRGRSGHALVPVTKAQRGGAAGPCSGTAQARRSGTPSNESIGAPACSPGAHNVCARAAMRRSSSQSAASGQSSMRPAVRRKLDIPLST
jgi:hypothetical protein